MNNEQQRPGPGGPEGGSDSKPDAESNYTELDDLISGSNEENKDDSK